ncbi:divalent-cation tolerance protein CutA, partial [Streptomyces sp. NPDC051940]|uniref:divalent-cation tolerance protein CutA n=1 Tax=Streptomyces sp. NPDC051940 TaxID=3155675 RepID=UPI00341E2DAC
TTSDEREAQHLARGAVERRLAACAQVGGPVTSVYRWQGAVDTAREWQVVFKTVRDRYPALEAYLREAHSYDTPEIIATEIAGGSPEYLAWVAAETRETGDA